MLEYIKGKITEANPSYLIVETGGIGYFINISLYAYETITGKYKEDQDYLIYIHQIIREDAIALYGFSDQQERLLFRRLISVSGVGANTARLILSSLSTNEIIDAITCSKVDVLKNIKGIGSKSAQRIIVDLKDKISKEDTGTEELFTTTNNSIQNEALSALVTLGFARSGAEKIIQIVLKQNTNISIEGLVKECLKRL
jgi:holliday junction DNA helicase RuvA